MRNKLPDRYYSVTVKLEHKAVNGTATPLLVTYGLDDKTRRVQAVFCSSFKAGTEMNTLVMDGCKLMSLLLQHGYGAADLADRLDKEAPSILGTLARGAMETEK